MIKKINLDDEVDCGIEITSGGQTKHIWLRPEDVKNYIEDLRKEIKRLQAIEKRVREAKFSQCIWEDGENIVLMNGKPIGMTITKHNREFDRWWESAKAELLYGDKTLPEPLYDTKDGKPPTKQEILNTFISVSKNDIKK